MPAINEIEAQVLAELRVIRPEERFEGRADYVEAGLLDSLDIVSLVSALDARFKISIDGAAILPENFSSAASIAALVAATIAKAKPNSP